MKTLFILFLFLVSFHLNAQRCPSASGDEVSYGNGDDPVNPEWIGYVYNGADNFNTSDYQGFIKKGLIFNEVFCAGACSFTAESGCNVSGDNFSVRFKTRRSFPCDFYTFTIGGDDGVRLSLDGGSTYVIDDYESHPYRLTTPLTVFLNGTYDLVLDYYDISDENRVSFNLVAENATLNTLTQGGTIGDDQDVCNTPGYDPSPLISLSEPAVCPSSALSYQWESSLDNINFSAIPGATATTYDPPVTGFQKTYYRRRVDFGTQVAYSNIVTVSSGEITGDEISYGDGDAAVNPGWIGYIYDGANNFSTEYQGFITEPVFFDESFCGAECDFPTAGGCKVNTESFSIRFKMRKKFSCEFYTFELGSDNGARLSIDGGASYIIDDFDSHPYRTRSYSTILDGTYDLVLEYYEGGGGNRVSFSYSASGTSLAVLSDAGTIGESQSACGATSLDPVTLTNITYPIVCPQSSISYQWQSSLDNINFTDIPSAIGESYDPPASASNTIYYRRQASSGGNSAFSNTLSINYGLLTGDQNTYGDGDAATDPGWIGYLYDGDDNFNTSDYKGFIRESIDFDESFCGDDCNFDTEGGCGINSETFSVRFRMRKTFSCDLYTFTIGGDNGVRLSLDGGSTYVIDDYTSHNSYRTAAPYSVLLDGVHELVLDYYEISGQNRVSFEVLGSGTVPTTLTEGGTIQGDQSACSSTAFDPEPLKSVLVPNVCPQSGLSYQWESSTDNVSYSDVSGATDLGYDPPATTTSITYYRRRADFGGTSEYSNVVSINYGSITGDETAYGDGNDATNPGWIGYVYDVKDNFDTENYKGIIREPVNFDESFCGNDCDFLTEGGCPVNSQGFSVRFKMRLSLSCNFYTFIIGGDNGVRLSLDGGKTYVIDDYTDHPYREAAPYEVLLDGVYDIVLDYMEGGGGNRVTFNYTFSGTPATTLTDGGKIMAAPGACAGGADAPEISNMAVPNLCPQSALSYQWELSPDNINFTEITDANNVSYTPMVEPSNTIMYYRRRAEFSGTLAYSDTVAINYGARTGDTDIYGDGNKTAPDPGWIGYVYEGIDTYAESDYRGFITMDTVFTTTFCGDDCNLSTDGGCIVYSENMSIRFKMRKNFPRSIYRFEVTSDNNVRLSFDGGMTFPINATTALSPSYNTYEIELDGDTDLVLEYYESGEANNLSFDFTVIDPLPIQLKSFMGTHDKGKNIVHWETATETENDFFTLEKSEKGEFFDVLGIIEGAGNSSSILRYQFVDRTPFTKQTYYRLKQTDFDGSFSYSSTIRVASNAVPFLVMYDLESQRFLIRAPSLQEGIHFRLTELSGKEVYKKFFPKSAFNAQGELRFQSEQYQAEGVYVVSVFEQGKSEVLREKIVIQR